MAADVIANPRRRVVALADAIEAPLFRPAHVPDKNAGDPPLVAPPARMLHWEGDMLFDRTRDYAVRAAAEIVFLKPFDPVRRELNASRSERVHRNLRCQLNRSLFRNRDPGSAPAALTRGQWGGHLLQGNFKFGCVSSEGWHVQQETNLPG